MSRSWSLLIVLFMLLAAVGLGAQEQTPQEPPPGEENPDSPPIESGWDNYNVSLYSPGDKTFIITLGLIIPTYFSGSIQNNDHGLSLGGTGSLAFNYFLTSNIYLGGELGGMFCFTRGNNSLFIIPVGLRIGYQFVFKSFEFPFTLMVGGAPQKKLEESYFGLIIKPGAAVFWRFNPDWSFGFNANWWFVPQWPKKVDGTRYNVYGNFLELTLSARYHF